MRTEPRLLNRFQLSTSHLGDALFVLCDTYQAMYSSRS